MHRWVIRAVGETNANIVQSLHQRNRSFDVLVWFSCRHYLLPVDARLADAREVEDETLIVVQVENTKAIDNIPEIAAVPGIDIVFIGPRDLSATLGKLNDFSDPAVRQEIERAERAIVKSGKLMGSTAVTGKVAREMVERGHRFLISGSDATLLGSAAAAMMADARAK